MRGYCFAPFSYVKEPDGLSLWDMVGFFTVF